MSRLSAHQLERRMKKLESMPDAPETHVILVTFGDDQIGDQLECRGTVYRRLAGEDDSVFRGRIVDGLEADALPIVLFS